MSDEHPTEGDTLKLTGIVHKTCILGLTLPCGYELANKDETFDEYTVEVTDRNAIDEHEDILTLKTEDGGVTTVTYRGRSRLGLSDSITEKNSQGATQSYTWKFA